jgi:hypothetical protein
MAEPAIRRMTVDDFLRREDGTDTRYDLVDGFVLAIAPPAPRYGNRSVIEAKCSAKRQ